MNFLFILIGLENRIKECRSSISTFLLRISAIFFLIYELVLFLYDKKVAVILVILPLLCKNGLSPLCMNISFPLFSNSVASLEIKGHFFLLFQYFGSPLKKANLTLENEKPLKVFKNQNSCPPKWPKLHFRALEIVNFDFNLQC